MPANNNNSNSSTNKHKARRKGISPKHKQDKDHVWRLALQHMCLEPLSSRNSTSSSNSSSSSSSSRTSDCKQLDSTDCSLTTNGMAAPPPTSAPAPAQDTELPKSLLSLPVETQKHIVKHCSNAELLALCLVSKHFRDLAAERLYRKFEVTFPDELDDGANPNPDALAGGLETLVSSDYNYAKYLKEILLEPTNTGEKGERAYRYYLYDSSCGKFMNTLFLLALRKAKVLESFKWDIRVELSRPVFAALHSIPALQHLHLRMHAGHSLYHPPSSPAVTYQSAATPVVMVPATLAPAFGPPHNPGLTVTYPSTETNSFNNNFQTYSKIASKVSAARAKAVLPAIKKPLPSLSGFKHLRSLSILDMDTYDYIGELRSCIRNCSPTLTSLSLSFSESFANKSRKPPPEVPSDDDSEVEDEFGQLMPPAGGPPPPQGMPSNTSDPSAPFKAIKAQEERKKQEETLHKIFGLESGKKAKVSTTTKAEPDITPPKQDEDLKLKFIRNYAVLARGLMQEVKKGSDLTPEGQKALEMIKSAAKLYIDGLDKDNKIASSATGGSSNDNTAPSTTVDATPEVSLEAADAATEDDGPSLFADTEEKKQEPIPDPDISNPDNIDIEEPEASELAIEAEIPSAEVMSTEAPTSDDTTQEFGDQTESSNVEAEVLDLPATGDAVSSTSSASMDIANKLQVQNQIQNLIASHSVGQKEALMLKQHMEELQQKMKLLGTSGIGAQDLVSAEADFNKVSKRIAELSRNMTSLNKLVDMVGAEAEAVTENSSTQMSEYVRTARGFTLKTLSIYLIPVKSAVLNSALDFTALQSLTLLNVGPQIGIWTVLCKENKISPLPLNKIYTDNVTVPFLHCINELEKVTELLLLEKQKGRVESTAARTIVTINHIRKLVLKKHAPTLKVLMIKHDSDSTWDLDPRSMMLLCHRAEQLEELSASFGTETMHVLLQYMPGLTSLRALHTIALRTQDTCHAMLLQFKRFTVDSVAHNPQMKLEYLALHESVDRLVRRSKGAGKNKGKGKAKRKSAKIAIMEIMALSSDWVENGATEFQVGSSDDEDDYGVETGLKVETVDRIRFSDVPDVRIFEKEVIEGRL